MNRFHALGMAAILSAGCAQAAFQAPPVAHAMDADTAIAARQASFTLSAVAFNGMKGAIDRGQPAKSQAFAAKALARWSSTLPRLFPAGSTAATSRAKAEIWSKRADFDAKAASFAAAASALAAAAERDDASAFATQWTATQKTCAACHDAFRAEAKRP